MKRMIIECSDNTGPVRLIFDEDAEIDFLDVTLPTIVQSGKAFRIVDSRSVSVCINPNRFIRSVTIPEGVKVDDVFTFEPLGV